MILDRRGRIFVVAIIAGSIIVFTAMYIGASRQAEILEKDVGIDLVSISVKSIDTINSKAILEVTFKLNNNSGTVMSVGEVSYDLSANDKFICKGTASYRDIPLVGRPQIFSYSESGPIRTECEVMKSDEIIDIWNSIVNNNIENITWRAKGIAEVESSISVIEKRFDIWI